MTETRTGNCVLLVVYGMELVPSVRRGVQEWKTMDGLERAHKVVRVAGTGLGMAVIVRRLVRDVCRERGLRRR